MRDQPSEIQNSPRQHTRAQPKTHLEAANRSTPIESLTPGVTASGLRQPTRGRHGLMTACYTRWSAKLLLRAPSML